MVNDNTLVAQIAGTIASKMELDFVPTSTIAVRCVHLARAIIAETIRTDPDHQVEPTVVRCPICDEETPRPFLRSGVCEICFAKAHNNR